MARPMPTTGRPGKLVHAFRVQTRHRQSGGKAQAHSRGAEAFKGSSKACQVHCFQAEARGFWEAVNAKLWFRHTHIHIRHGAGNVERQRLGQFAQSHAIQGKKLPRIVHAGLAAGAHTRTWQAWRRH